MATVDVRSSTGSTVGSIRLDDAVFGVTPNVPVMHQVVTAQLAAARAGTQSTKTRAEVSGGGRKPWRQKGSGRARQGSTRAPHWRGGGIALGPKPRGYRQRTPKKMVQLALHSALSDRASAGKVAVVDAWTFTAPKTKDAKAALRALGLEGQGKVLVVVEREAEAVYKSFRNLPDVQLLLASELNAYDVLCNDWVVFTRSTLPGVTSETAASSGTAPEVQATADEPAAVAPAAGEPEAEPLPRSEPDWDAPLRPGFGQGSGDEEL
jgi:large subunit ribosomal protein L4